jgi:signal transduction histidine kinase
MQERLRRMVRRLKWKITILWLGVSMLPLLILLVFVAMMLGPRYGMPVPTGAFFDEVVWQLDTWNEEERTFRELNRALLEDPESLYNGRLPDALEELDKHLILIRRGEEVRALHAMSEEETRQLGARINEVEGEILPAFGETTETHNRALFEATGYIVSRQLDFRYSDGATGSAYLLTRVVNIPARVAAFVMRYFLTAFLVLLVLLLFITYRFGRGFSRRLGEMVEATHRVRDGDFSVRLDDDGEGPFDALAEELNNMIEGLAEAKRFRENTEVNRKTFISHLTHDLKTPLAGIGMHVEALHDGIIDSPEARQRSYEDVQKKIAEVHNMLAELALYNELESVEVRYHKRPVDAMGFVDDIIQEWGYDQTGVEVKTSSALPPGTRVLVDPGKMRRVLINLLENSTKHVAKRPLEIHLEVRSRMKRVEILLWDDGPGVPEAALPHLFERYYRVDDARNQDRPGSGLGLSICQKIVTDHGGTMAADLHPSGGLRITLSLPRAGEGDDVDETTFDHRG